MLSAILPSNRLHLELALQKVLDTGRRRIGMLGLAFKAGTDDLRESPLVLLAEQLIGKGLDVVVYDPNVHLSNLLGSNRAFIERHLPHIGKLICGDLAEVVAASEVIVASLSDAATVDALAALLTADHVLIDLAGIRELARLPGRHVGLCW
jgi:GDP-mannose 6-dehydrogenase